MTAEDLTSSGIFIYIQSTATKNIMYVGTEASDICDLRPLHNYGTLLDEFKINPVQPVTIDSQWKI